MQKKKSNIIQQILYNNGYNTSFLKSISDSKQCVHGTMKTQWSKFTYIGRDTRAITKTFKNTTVKVAYSTNNTLEKLLTKKHNPHRSKKKKP